MSFSRMLRMDEEVIDEEGMDEEMMDGVTAFA